MSLATRCFACGTVFRVVQDQLKVSEGWVRCGRCNEVFNALETLFDLERDTPPEWTPSEPEPAAESGPSDDGVAAAAPGDQSLVDRLDAQLIGARRSESGSTPATRIDERDRLEFPDAQFEPESSLEDDSPALPPVGPRVVVHDEHAHTQLLVDEAPPEFLRRAQRRARWHSPMARIALGSGALVLALVLVLQWAHHSRDLVAARWPGLRPALSAWCDVSGCAIQALRRIEDIAVESTALTRATGADAFRLAVTLRNRGTLALARPSIDLSLTDATGQLVARRMLAPSEFSTNVVPIAAGAELPLQLLLTAGGARVTGYTVEVFYP